MARERLLTPGFLRLWIFALITFISAFQLLPTIPFRILALGGTKAQAGWFLAAYTYASAFAAPLTGAIADHFGRRRLLMLAAGVFILFSLLYGIVTPLPLLLVIACVHGALWSGILSASAAIMADEIPESRRTEGIAYWGMASTAAVAVAPSIGLAVHDRYGWLALCLELTFLSCVMVWLAWRTPRDRQRVTGPFPPLRQAVDLRVVALAMSLFVMSFGYGGVTSFAALLATDRHVVPTSIFFNVFAATILLSRLFTASIGDRRGPKALLYPSLLLVPVGLLSLAFAETAWSVGVSAFIFGLGFGGAYPSFVAYVLGHSDPARRGSTFGSILWAFDTGIGTGSLVLGIVIDHASYRAAFSTAAALSLLAIPLFVVISRRLFEGLAPALLEPGNDG